ncbi:MAG: hypothetical protein ABWK00_01910 [Desulfurococcaceae archaeon]
MEELRRRVLRTWMRESASYNFSIAISTSIAQAYAIQVLGFGIERLGLLASLQTLAVGLGYLAGVLLLSAKRRLRMLLWKAFGALNRLLLALAGFSDLLPGSGYAFVALISAAQFSGGVANLAYMDTGADLVERSSAVRFFSRMSSYNMASYSAALALSTALLALGAKGYRLSYSAALAAAALSASFLARIRDLGSPSGSLSASAALGVLRNRDYLGFTLTFTAFFFFVNMPGALWNYFLLNVFGGAGYWVPLTTMASSLGQSLGYRAWGRLYDRLGPRRTCTTAMAMVGLVPVAFLYAPTLPAQIVYNVYTGISWSGLNLVANVYYMYLAREGERVFFVAANMMLQNVVSSTAPGIGSSVASRGLQWAAAVFYASSAGRLAVAALSRRSLPPLGLGRAR